MFYDFFLCDEMIDEQEANLRNQAGSQEPAQEYAERALVKGSIMQLDAEGNVRSDEKAIQVTDGIVAPFMFKNAEVAAKFEGTKVGDKVVFNPFDTCENSVDGEVVEHFHLHVGAEALAQLVDVDMAFAEAGNIFGFADVFGTWGSTRASNSTSTTSP